jgi:hypothetical protein
MASYDAASNVSQAPADIARHTVDTHFEASSLALNEIVSRGEQYLPGPTG